MKSAFNKRIVKCTVVGDSHVGKTTLVKKFLKLEEVNDEMAPTVFDNFAGEVAMEEGESTVSIFDTTGEHDLDGLRQLPYALSDAIIVCYSVIDRVSFKNISNFWFPEIKKITKKGTLVVLVATHCDLRNSSSNTVKEDEGATLAKEIGAYTFVETSCIDITNISKLFEIIATKVAKRNKNIISKLFRR